MTDLVHRVSHNGVEPKKKIALFNDEPDTIVREQKLHVPTCLQNMPVCTYKNRAIEKERKEVAQKLAKSIDLAQNLQTNLFTQVKDTAKKKVD